MKSLTHLEELYYDYLPLETINIVNLVKKDKNNVFYCESRDLPYRFRKGTSLKWIDHRSTNSITRIVNHPSANNRFYVKYLIDNYKLHTYFIFLFKLSEYEYINCLEYAIQNDCILNITTLEIILSKNLDRCYDIYFKNKEKIYQKKFYFRFYEILFRHNRIDILQKLIENGHFMRYNFLIKHVISHRNFSYEAYVLLRDNDFFTNCDGQHNYFVFNENNLGNLIRNNRYDIVRDLVDRKYLNLSIVNDFYGSILCNQYSNYGKKVKQFKWNDEMIELMFKHGVIFNDRTIDEAFGNLYTSIIDWYFKTEMENKQIHLTYLINNAPNNEYKFSLIKKFIEVGAEKHYTMLDTVIRNIKSEESILFIHFLLKQEFPWSSNSLKIMKHSLKVSRDLIIDVEEKGGIKNIHNEYKYYSIKYGYYFYHKLEKKYDYAKKCLKLYRKLDRLLEEYAHLQK